MKLAAVRTVDGDGDALRESEAILANEGGNLAKAAGLQVLDAGVAALNLNDVEVEVVGLRDRLDGDGAGVTLRSQASQPL